ncbi:MAG: glycosyltransferase family 4 protein [Aureliella sp.]
MLQKPPTSVSQVRVVFLVNFVSPNLVEVLRQVEQQVGSLQILASVPIEANRLWRPDHGDLPVIVQRTKTVRRIVEHPGGYSEELFVHLPLDTFGQLRRLRPDCIVSLEMGMRSLMSSLYRSLWRRSCRHVLAVYGSERSEQGRGRVRRALRRRLLAAADVITYNGPSCRRYLLGLGASPEKMMPWNYAADPAKPYRGSISGYAGASLRLLTVGQLIPRKGILEAARALDAWARAHPERTIEWALAGTGPLSEELSRMALSPNLRIDLLGHREPAQLQELYRDYPVMFFPTLGDEWGLVVDEALASGQLVLGSIYSQAVETLIEPGRNGWQYDPEVPETLRRALDQLAMLDREQADRMREQARRSVEERTHVQSAQQFVDAVGRAFLTQRRRD